MSRILLADDSPHAQRMAERILRDEGHEVITVSDGLVAMLRLKDAHPDLIIADISMPEVSGYEVCEYVKNNGGEPVFLTAGAVESVDDSEVARVRADGVLKKPFEASLLLEAVGRFSASKTQQTAAASKSPAVNPGPPRAVVVLDQDQVRAAVTVALDAAMPGLVDEISARVLSALTGAGRARKADA
jgi:CheY-like chemotaxis protein